MGLAPGALGRRRGEQVCAAAPGLVVAALVALGMMLSFPNAARSAQVTDKLEVYGYLRAWMTIREGMEEAKGLYQHPSRDEAASTTTGFSLEKARIGLRLRLAGGRLLLFGQVRLERSFSLMEAGLAYRFGPWLTLGLGQTRIPGPWENMVDNTRLDFVLRSRAAGLCADYSLSRTVHASSHFAGNRSYLRDLGIFAQGEVALPAEAVLRYRVMAANGLGSNLYIGGGTRAEFIVTNPPQLFVGARLEVARILGLVTVGGHVSWNKHDNIVFNSGRRVYDLDRLSGSGDLRLVFRRVGLRLAAAYIVGRVGEDYDADGNPDLAYRGWEARVLWNLGPALGLLVPGGWRGRHGFELGFRAEGYTSDVNASGSPVSQYDWTIGLSYRYRTLVALQLNYVHRVTDDPANPDLGDDLLVLAVQGSY